MWFGNCVTATNWRDVLLFQEGLATLLEDDFVTAQAPGTGQWVKPRLYSGETVASLSTTMDVTATQYRIASGLMRQLRIEMDGSAAEPAAPRFREMLKTIATESCRHGYLTRADFKVLGNRFTGRDLSAFYTKYAF